MLLLGFQVKDKVALRYGIVFLRALAYYNVYLQRLAKGNNGRRVQRDHISGVCGALKLQVIG